MNLPTDLQIYLYGDFSHLSLKAVSQWTNAIGKLIRIDMPKIKKIWYLEDILTAASHPSHYKIVLIDPKNRNRKEIIEFISLGGAVRNGHDKPRVIEKQ